MEILFSIIFLLIFITFIVSFFIYHRSTLATIAEFVIKLVYKVLNIDEKISSPENKLPKYKFKSKVITNIYEGFEVNTIFKNENIDSITIYLHGGSYTNEASYFHYRFVDNLAQSLNTKVLFIHYPLAPEHTCEDAFVLLDKIYNNIIENTTKRIIIMGDSAGGGLALAFTQHLNNKKISQPNKIVLISPWIDISMTNKEMKEYEHIDPMLDIAELQEAANKWKGNLDIKDYEVSPLYGKMKKLNDILLFTGDREILYPDILLLNEKLKNSKVNVKLIVGKSMNHIYPLYPIKEAKNALKEIIDFIKD